MLWWAALSRPDKIPTALSTRFFKVWRDFLCVGQARPPRCLSEAAAIYIVSRRSKDNLLKKALLARGTFLLSK